MALNKRIRILIVDDSALVRNILQKGLSSDPSIEVVGTAPDVFVARDKIVELSPDVMTLDIEMPRMDGVEFLRRLMPQYPIPTVIVSSLSQRGKQITLDALDAGAVDFVAKPTSDVARALPAMLMELLTKIKIASTANVSHWKHKKTRLSEEVKPAGALSESTDKVIAIGASTGGTEAIRRVIENFPANMPGTVIVQHMPPGFTKMFADRLNQICKMEVKEAEHGERILMGKILIAPGGDRHLRVVRSGGIYTVSCEPGEKVNGHCPSVDVMMHSVAKHVGANAVGVMLTGMGKDGAEGMLEMRKAGAFNIAQDEKTSVVYGMPCVANSLGGVNLVLPLDEIAKNVINAIANN